MDTKSDSIPTNASTATPLAMLISRRAVLGGLGAVAAAGMFPRLAFSAPNLETSAQALSFTPVAPGLDKQLGIAPGYGAEVLLRFGDALTADAPAYNPQDRSAEDQNQQFGTGCDYIAYFPLPAGSTNSNHGLLVVNHEFSNTHLMFAGVEKNEVLGGMTPARTAAEQAALGVSVVEVKRGAGGWSYVQNSQYNRRITAQSYIRLSGAAAGDKRLQTHGDPSGRLVRGTFGNCAGGQTPWGTYLTCEENINFFFSGALPKSALEETENHRRMGVTGRRGGYAHWGRDDSRFDVSVEPREANRFGWVVEIDPFDASSTPVKRTALGRFKHESATVVLSADNRVVVYSGDDQAFEFLYKFVSSKRYNPLNRAANRDILDSGTLYVAEFLVGGGLRWLPLQYGQGVLTPENGFNSQADVLIEARRAATLLGATPLDRPEDIAVHPQTGAVYVALTKNAARKQAQVDGVNPRADNRFGQIVAIFPERKNHTATTATWDIAILAGDEESGTAELANPDNLTFDPAGRLWIATDGAEDSIGFADGVFATTLIGENPALKQLLRVPEGAEATGPCFTPDGTTLFVSIQHPAADSENQAAARSRFPDYDPALPARAAIIAVRHNDGLPVGG